MTGALSFELNTKGLAPTAAFDMWQDYTFANTGRVLDISGDASAFWVDQRAWRGSGIMVLEARLTPLTFERSKGRARRDLVDNVCFEWTRGVGGNGTESPKGYTTGGHGAVAITDLSRPFVRRVTNADFITFAFERRLLREGDIEAMHGGHLSGARARMIGDFFTSFSHGFEPEHPKSVEKVVAAVVSAVVAGSADKAREAADTLGSLALNQARTFIDANLQREGIAMEEVVAATEVSRATLYRLFRPYGGLARFMWSRRLDKAREAICNPADARPLVMIAEAFGFSDAAHFTRAFKNEFGVKPSDLRAFR